MGLLSELLRMSDLLLILPKRLFFCKLTFQLYDMRFTLWIAIFAALTLWGCKKQEEVIVPGNTPPPDQTISNIAVESYINRSYISLLGRKPDQTETNTGLGILRAHNFSQADRNAFLDDVMGKQAYHQNLFDIGRVHYIEGVDTSEIQENLTVFNILVTDPNYQAIWPQIQIEIDKLELVLDIVPDLRNGSLDVKGMHGRFVFNYVYDQLNMGTQNFVISCFQRFLFRYPTTDELEKSELMVNGFPSQIFLETGKTKSDFIQIMLDSRDYAEGQVRDLYARYLFREPSSEEMSQLAQQYLGSNDYQGLQKAILATDEYAGI